MRLPEINLQELEKIKKENFRERLEFQDRYVKWMKLSNNVKWSSAQKAVVNRKSTGSSRHDLGRLAALKTRHARHHGAKTLKRL